MVMVRVDMGHKLLLTFLLASGFTFVTPTAERKSSEATGGAQNAGNIHPHSHHHHGHQTLRRHAAEQRSLNDEYGPPQSSYYPSHDPEPIIEIIIKDSNESLPAPPPVYSAPPTKPTKEPVQVFYVKYKKNPNAYGKEDDIIYEPPVPALTPPTNNADLENHTPLHTIAYTTPAPLPPRPSTTLRTIIRPDSEIYHGTGGVKVTFGKTEIHHPAPVISHREDSSNDHVTKRDSHAVSSGLQPVRRNPEYRSPILNQNEFQALPPDYNIGSFNGPFNPPNDYNPPNNAIGDFSAPFKGPSEYNTIRNSQEFGQNFDASRRPGFDGPKYDGKGPIRSGPPNDVNRGQQNFNGPPRPGSFDGPIRQNPNFDGPIRNGAPFDGPVRDGTNNFNGPIRNGPSNFNGPVRNGPPFDGPVRQNYEEPLRNSPNNFNRPVNGDSYSPQNNGNFGGNRPPPSALTKVAFPGNALPQQYQRPSEIQNQGPSPVYKPNQPQQAQFQQAVRQEKPFVPSQPIYSPQELYQPPAQYQQNSYVSEQEKRAQQINGFQQASIKTPPMQQFNTYDAVRKPAQVPSYDQEFTKKPSFDQQYVQQTKTNYSPAKQSTEIASFEEPLSYTKSPSVDSKVRQQQQLYELQKQQEVERQQQELERQQQAQLQQLQQQYYQQQQSQQTQQYSKPQTQTETPPLSYIQQQQQIYNKAPSSSTYNVEQQNNLFVQNEQSLNSFKPGTELSEEEYKILLEKQRLAEVKKLQKERDQAFLQQAQQLQEQQQALQQFQQQAQRLQNHRSEQSESQTQTQSKLSQYQPSKKTQDIYSKPTTIKYVSSTQPSVKYQSTGASQSTTAGPEVTTEFTKEQKEKFNKNLLALPDEVPEDIRQQLLSSGILGNADIQILDYDKVGDIPIENLPPEALANFYGAGGGAAQKRSSEITKRSAESAGASGEQAQVPVEMKVVKFNPETPEGQQLAASYLQGQQGGAQGQTRDVTLDPVVLNDASYNRYLPLKVDGASFPLPNSELLRNRRITSVVVLAPVDYDAIIPDETRTAAESPDHVTSSGSVHTHDHRDGKAVKVAGVRFVSGNILNELLKNPTEGNFRHWLGAEKQFPVSKQSILLLVASPANSTNAAASKEIFMYDFNSDNISELKGDLSETFLQVAESNASSDDLENVSEETRSSSATPVSPGPSKELNKRNERQELTPVDRSKADGKAVIKRETRSRADGKSASRIEKSS